MKSACAALGSSVEFDIARFNLQVAFLIQFREIKHFLSAVVSLKCIQSLKTIDKHKRVWNNIKSQDYCPEHRQTTDKKQHSEQIQK